MRISDLGRHESPATLPVLRLAPKGEGTSNLDRLAGRNTCGELDNRKGHLDAGRERPLREGGAPSVTSA